MAHIRQSRPDSGLGLSHCAGVGGSDAEKENGSTKRLDAESANDVAVKQLNLRTTTSQKCEAVPRRARI